MGKTEVQEGQELAGDDTGLPGPSQGFSPRLASAHPTCIDVAVPHGMDGMLAFSSTLAKEPGGQGLCTWEGVRPGGVTHVHHLVGRVQGLEAALAVLPKALPQSCPLIPVSSRLSPQSQALAGLSVALSKAPPDL